MDRCKSFFNNSYNYINSLKKVRFLLPITLISFCLIDENVRNNPGLYIFIVFITSLIILINFPLIVTWSNSKPLYYDELYIDNSKLPSLKLSDDSKRYYKKAYKIILTIYDSLIIALISNYWFFKTKNAKSYYEIIGVTGGILQIFHILNLLTGTIVLYVIKYFINNTHKIAISNDEEFVENVILHE